MGKFADITYRDTKSRVSTVLTFIFMCLLIIRTENDIEYYIMNGLIGLVMAASIIWLLILLPKRPKTPVVSKNEWVAFLIYDILWFAGIVVWKISPEIFPTWTNTFIWGVLFSGLTYFALSTPTTEDIWKKD